MGLLTRIDSLAMSHLNFVKKAFSDNGQPSSSRLLTLLHSLTSIFLLLYIGIKTRTWPSLDVATGLGGFAVVHYGVNRVSGMFGGQKKDRDGGGSDNTPPPPASQGTPPSTQG